MPHSSVPRIGTKGVLTPEEKELARDVVDRRDQRNRASGVVDRKMSYRSSLEINLDGYGAEIFFAGLFGLKPDTTDYCRGGQTDTGDFVLNGRLIDVKCRPGGKFMVPEWKKRGRRIDYYAMVVGSFERGYEFRGFIAWAEIFRPERLQMIKVMSYVADQTDLKELYELEKPQKEVDAAKQPDHDGIT